MELISVIVPIYNVEEYLKRCIESIVNQTFKNLEIILVDDGSTDASGEICDKYAEKDTRIKVIHKKNGGLSSARNAGIDVAQGKYIAFLDSDDWIESNLYEYLYSLMKKNSASMAECDFIKAYDENIKISYKGDIQERIYNNIEALQRLYGEAYIKTTVVWNKVYEKELFKDIRFPEGKLHEDEFTTYKIIYKAKKVIVSNIPMIYYRQREKSIMSGEFNEKRLDVLQAYKERISYMKDKNLDELDKMTEASICSILRLLYIQTKESKIERRNEILIYLKSEMKNMYSQFMHNKFITKKGKLMLNICLLNETLFYEIYKKYMKRNMD